VHQGRLPDSALPDHSFDAVLSKDMLHHLPDPQILWREARRLARPGAAVYVMDLVRPDSPLEAREIVARVSGGADPVLKEDFYNSLCAAFTVEEVRAQLRVAGLLLHVELVSDRHMRVKGRIA
jgi:SAM-dependent methyltransferase